MIHHRLRGTDKGDPYWNNVSLLLHGDGDNDSTTFTDSSKNTLTVNVNNGAKLSNGQSKFGGTSMYFDGTNDYANITANNVLGFGENNVTIECFYYPVGIVNSNNQMIMGSFITGWGWNRWFLADRIASYTTKLSVFAYNYAGYEPLLLGDTTITDGSWYHIAIVKNGNDYSLFLNGVLDASRNSTATLNYDGGADCVLTIGSGGTANWGTQPTYTNCYVDELRITKGVARYTGNFTPPSAPFPNR